MKNTKTKLRLSIKALTPVILLTLLHFQLLAQQEIKPAYLSLAEGVASTMVKGIIQDSQGLIWVSTNNGMQKYNGYKFETFRNDPQNPASLQNNNVWGLLEDPQHNIWAATDMGVSRFNRRTKTFTNYNFTKQFNLQGVSGRTFYIFIDSSQRLWAGTNAIGLLNYNPKKDIWEKAKYKSENNEKEIELYGTILPIVEDSSGNIWAGSYGFGLIYKRPSDSFFKPAPIKKPDFTSSDPTNSITWLFIDSTDTIWITTRNGIYKYNPANEAIKTIATYNYRQIETWNNWNSINQDSEGNIWIANNFKGLLKFDGLSDNFQEIHMAGNHKLPDQGWSVTLTDFIIDKSGIFWFGSRSKGLIKYDPAKNPFVHYTHNKNDKASLANNSVFGLTASRSKPGIVYVGTKGSGLDIFDEKTKTFRHVSYNVVNDFYKGSVRSIGEKDDGTLLLGTWGDGLIELDKDYQEVKRYTYAPNSETSIFDNRVRVIKPDKSGNFWIGTNNGLNYFNSPKSEFKRIQSKSLKTYSSELVKKVESLAKTDNKVAAITNVTNIKELSQVFEISEAGSYLVEAVGEGDASGMYDFGWITNADNDTIWNALDFHASFHAGGAVKNRFFIDQIQLTPGQYNLHYLSDDSHSFGKWNEPAPDKTKLYGIVLVRIPDQETSQQIHNLLNRNYNEEAISGENIAAIMVRDNYLWVGTDSDGLNKIDLETNKITTYQYEPENLNSLSSNNVRDVCEDDQGIIWIATDLGITRFDPVKNEFTRYTEHDGLPTNFTDSILPGDNGEMWISTDNGLSQMVINPSLGLLTFINYNSEDGLGGNTFLPQAAARAPDGKFWFGGDHGLNGVSKVKANNVPPDLVLTDLLISNKSIYNFDEESLITTDLADLKELKLNYNQNNLSFEFAALHYANPKKNQYAHILKGYDTDWSYDNRNYAAYTNLPPGKYEFKIRASNAFGIWNEAGKSIRIIISPPWWQTLWAYSIYALLFLGSIVSFDRVQRRRVVTKERLLAKEKELKQAKEIEKAYTELKATQAQLIQQEKMASLGQLTAGIAHEIKNPLNFVNNFAELASELVDELREEIETGRDKKVSEITPDLEAILVDLQANTTKINEHGKRADSIVKGMLQHSRGTAGERQLTDINAMLEESLNLAYHGIRARDSSFNSTIETNFDTNLAKIEVVPQNISRVFLNIIANGFYAAHQRSRQNGKNFSPTLSIKSKAAGNKIEIKIRDNGNGIPKDIREKIFQPFFTTKPTGQGTGLGLSISYDIVVQEHGGEIRVDSKEGEFTEFTITLPR